MLQIKAVANEHVKIKAWGVSMDGAAVAAGVQWELLETGLIFATVTASAAADFIGMDSEGQATGIAKYLTLGTAATGYTSTAEGTVAATRVFDTAFITPTDNFVREFPVGQEPVAQPGQSLRIRCKAASAANAICWMLIEVV
jgi:hypothetical protein